MTAELQFPGAPGPVQFTSTDCITAEDIADMPNMLTRELTEEQSCDLANMETTADSLTFDMVCEDDGAITRSHSETRFTEETFTSVTTMDVDGDILTATMNGKWVGAACTDEDDEP